MIADDAAARGIAGVMGGEDTGCTETTTNVFVESAYFDPVRIARDGPQARHRFGCALSLRARRRSGIRRAGPRTRDQADPGILRRRAVAKSSSAGAPPQWQRDNRVRARRGASGSAGLDVPADEIVRILTNLGFTVERRDAIAGHAAIAGAATSTAPPIWSKKSCAFTASTKCRPRRCRGPIAIARADADAGAAPRAHRAPHAGRARLQRDDFNFSFIPRANTPRCSAAATMRASSKIRLPPIWMRCGPAVLPSLLAAAQRNQARGFSELMLFEIGAQFESGMPGRAEDRRRRHPHRRRRAQLDEIHAMPPTRSTPKPTCWRRSKPRWAAPMTAPVKQGAAAWYHPGRSGTLALGPKVLAYFGELHPEDRWPPSISKARSRAFEVFLDAIPESESQRQSARAVFAPSPFQPVERDFAFVVDANVAADDDHQGRESRRARSDRVALTIFDVYEGKGVPEGKKSLAISVRLQPKDKTLTDAEIEAIARQDRRRGDQGDGRRRLRT